MIWLYIFCTGGACLTALGGIVWKDWRWSWLSLVLTVVVFAFLIWAKLGR